MHREWRLPVALALLALLGTVNALQQRAALSGPEADPATVAICPRRRLARAGR